jgi:hypothetical protein
MINQEMEIMGKFENEVAVHGYNKAAKLYNEQLELHKRLLYEKHYNYYKNIIKDKHKLIQKVNSDVYHDLCNDPMLTYKDAIRRLSHLFNTISSNVLSFTHCRHVYKNLLHSLSSTSDRTLATRYYEQKQKYKYSIGEMIDNITGLVIKSINIVNEDDSIVNYLIISELIYDLILVHHLSPINAAVGLRQILKYRIVNNGNDNVIDNHNQLELFYNELTAISNKYTNSNYD